MTKQNWSSTFRWTVPITLPIRLFVNMTDTDNFASDLRTLPGRFRSSTNPISKVFLARKGTVPYILVRNSSEKGAFQTNKKWIRIKMKSGKRIRITGILSTRTLNNYVSSPKLFTHDYSI